MKKGTHFFIIKFDRMVIIKCQITYVYQVIVDHMTNDMLLVDPTESSKSIYISVNNENENNY